MRHSISIMFGQYFAQTVQELKKYVIKHGEKELDPWFNAIHWAQNANGDVSLSKVKLRAGHADEFISGLNDRYDVELVTENFLSADKEHDAIVYYFDQLCASTVTSGNVGDDKALHLCLYISLYEPEFWEQAKTLITWVKSLNRPTHIDLVGFTSDLASVIQADDKTNAQQKRARDVQTKTTIQEIVAYRNDFPEYIYHFLVMQNMQKGGVSLNLNNDSFVRVLGEFAMMCVEKYDDIIGTVPFQKELQSFGLSALHFDKYYFIEYLLHKAYLFAMEREGIHQEEVDINMAFNKAKVILKDRLHILSDFLKKEVIPRLDKEPDENRILGEVQPLLDAKLNEIDSDCNAIINDKDLSIPAKRAILSALLGSDDELFVNTIYDEDSILLFDQLHTEAMNVFVDANNALLPPKKESGEYSDEEMKMFEKAVLSPDGEPVVYSLSDMKKNRVKMQSRIGDIRRWEAEKKQLEAQIGNISESKKCLVEGDFYIFGEQKFRLLPEIEEVPLKEDYVPHKVKADSVDLRKNFSRIKNQGQQGSCTAYALTSIYEYILKSNQAAKADLSEAFLYYNARKKEGKENSDYGSSYDLAVQSLVEDGICEESFMPYNEYDCTTPPEQNAIDNARLRRVKKAVNVKRNLEDLKSALEDGYPVAISVFLYDSFGQGHKGMVSLPTQDELKTAQNEENKHHRHAMVICGYDNKKKLFIVRNSWGTGFGDNGYCYMPYTYITNKKLVNFAAAVTEIETAEKYMVNVKPTKSVLTLDETDTAIRYAIINNLIAEEKQLLENDNNERNQLRKGYEQIKEKLKSSDKQNKLRNHTKERISKEIWALQDQYKDKTEEKYRELDIFDKETRKTGRKYSLISLSIVLFVFLLAYFVGWRVFVWKFTWYSFAVGFAIAGSLFLYFPYRKRKRNRLEAEFNDELTRIHIEKDGKEKELAQTSLKMHVTGYFLNGMFQKHSAIIAKRNAASSFLSNLKAWYIEENETIKHLDADTQMPFIPLLKNGVLDAYFEKHKKAITEHISLCSSIIDFSERLVDATITRQNLKEYKESIKEKCVKELEVLLQNFNVYSYLCNPTVKYEFLDSDPKFAEEILQKMDEKSNIFLCDNGLDIIIPDKSILIKTPSDNDAAQWRNFFPKYFSARYNPYFFSSPYKVMVFQLGDLNVSQIK